MTLLHSLWRSINTARLARQKRQLWIAVFTAKSHDTGLLVSDCAFYADCAVQEFEKRYNPKK